MKTIYTKINFSILFFLTINLSNYAGDSAQLKKLNNLMTIKDPYKEVWKKHEGKVAGMKRFFLDLNDDGEKELFLGPNSLLGKSGGIFYIFKKEDNYKSLGHIFIDLNNFELSNKKVNGFRIIKSFNKMGQSPGELNYYQFEKNGFTKNQSKKIDREKVNKVINQTEIKVEESGNNLKWKP